jgi:hypothetical protein
MPTKEGKLTQEDRDKANKWLTERGALTACEACKKQAWKGSPNLVMAPAYVPGGALVPPIVYPAVMLICTNCGFLRMHSAVVMGILPPDDEKQSSGKRNLEATHGV